MNASWNRRLLLVVLTTLLTLTLFTSAFATKPEFFTFQVDDTFVRGECDGFAVIENVEGTIKISTHFDKDGEFQMEISRYRLRHTFTNSETGESLTSPDVGIDKVTISEDGSVIVAVIGIVAHIVVPGEGPVYVDVGRIVFNGTTGELLFEAGQHDDFADLLPALCSALE